MTSDSQSITAIRMLQSSGVGNGEWGMGKRKSPLPIPHSLLPTPRSHSENHLPAIEIASDDDRLVGLDFAGEEFHRQRVLDHVLNGAFERARAVDRIETLARQKFFGRLVEPEIDLALFEHAAQRFELNLDDPAQLLDPEALENDQDVNEVEVLGIELRAQQINHVLWRNVLEL